MPQTFGSVLNVHPRVHCLASRGLWDENGQWLPVPYIDTTAAEKLFAHKILRLLKSKDLLSDERMSSLLSFRNSDLTDPLKCECGGTLRVIALITEQKLIRKILDHLEANRSTDSRAPP